MAELQLRDDPSRFLRAALHVGYDIIRSVAIEPLTGAGASPVLKYSGEIEWASEEVRERRGAPWDAGSHGVTYLFIKQVPTSEENAAKEQPLSDDILGAVGSAQRTEACFYRSVFALNDVVVEGDGSVGVCAADSEQSVAVLRRVMPMCLCATDTTLVLENTVKAGTFLTLCDWTLTSGCPSLSTRQVKACARALATLHYAVPPSDARDASFGTALDFDGLQTARRARMARANALESDQMYELLREGCECGGVLTADVDAVCRAVADCGYFNIDRYVYERSGIKRDGRCRGTLVHGDSNPGNMLVQAGASDDEESVILVDFQEGARDGAGLLDLARLLMTSMSPADRCADWESVLDAYCNEARSHVELWPEDVPRPALQEFKPLLTLCLLADALFVMCLVHQFYVKKSPELALMTDLGERCAKLFESHACDVMQLLQNEVAHLNASQ